MNIIERARELKSLIKEYSMKSEDKTLVIATSDYFDEWKAGAYVVGNICTNNGKPYECMVDHDSTVNTEWTIDVRTIWKPYHSRKQAFVLEWEQPSGSHDAYKQGEFASYEGIIYECLVDGCVWNPKDYPQGWKGV